MAIGLGLAWVFTDSLFGNLAGVGEDVSEGADKVVDWLRDNNDWAKQHEQQIRDFLTSILPAAKDAAGGVFEAALGGLSFTAQMVERRPADVRVPALPAHRRRRVWGWIRTASPRRAATGSPRRRARRGTRRAATSAASRSSR